MEPSGVLVYTDQNQRLANKTVSGNENTLTNISNSSLLAGISADKIASGTVDNQTFQCLAGVRSNIQNQIDDKSSSLHTRDASDITSGTFADSLVRATNVTQHQGSINILALSGSPASAVVGVNSTMTLTNKTISGLNNTVTDIGDTSLVGGIDVSKLADGTITNSMFQHLGGISSNIQTQLNGKSSVLHTHSAVDITSGTFSDARISASNVTQHASAISIATLSGAPNSVVVGVSDVQVLTNKTIDSSSNTVMATKLKTATGSIVLGAAAQPSAGQVLTATDSGTAIWQTPNSGTGTVTSVSLSVPSEFSVYGSPITGSGSLSFSKTSQNPSLSYAGPSRDITVGLTQIQDSDDSGNGGVLFATAYVLAQTATIQALSFYVTAAVGDLRLGIYSDNAGNPNFLIAQTESFTPVVGWNTIPVMSPVQLNASTYWLAYFPQSNGLHFRKSIGTGNSKYYAYVYGAMPGTWAISSQSSSTSQWNLYGLFTITGSALAPGFRSLSYSDIPDLTRRYVDLTSAQNLKNKSLATNTVCFADSSDSSKRLFLSTSSASTNTSLTLATQQTTSKILTVPDLTTNDTIVTTGTAQTIAGNKIFRRVDFLSSSTSLYSTGSASQTSTTITGSGTVFTRAMVGGLLVFANGSTSLIRAYTSSTSLTVTSPATVSAQSYTIYYGGYQQSDSGNLGATRLIINPLNAENIPLAICGTTSQTANLTEWLDSNGTLLSKVTPNGDFDITSFSGVYRINGKSVLAMPNATSVRVGDTNNSYGTNLGANNTLIGVNAGKSITTGHDHTLIGYNAGQALIATGADFCTFIGANAGYQCTGGDNLFMGEYAGYLVTTGTFNIAIGEDSLGYSGGPYTGSYNTLVGQRTLLSSTSAANACVFGYSAAAGTGGISIGANCVATSNELAIRAGNGTYLLKSSGTTLTLPNTTSTLTLGSNVMTFPGATDTIAGLTTTQSLTNKTLISNTNSIIARELWVASGASSVSTYAATAPTTGQVLKATSSSTATWQTVAGMTWRGAWSNATSYAVSDVVYNNSASWICILNHTNKIPPNGTYWNMLAVGFRWKSTWSSVNNYTINDVVTYNSVIYVCILGHTNQIPPDGSYWSVMMSDSAASALQTSTNQVAISGSAAPAVGQVITANSGTDAAWADQAPNCTEVSAIITTSTTSTSYVQMDSMTITPPAGSYFLTFSADALYSSSTGTAKYALYKGGAIVQHTERQYCPKAISTRAEITITAKVTVNGSEVVEIRYMVCTGTFTITGRSMQALRVT